MLQLHKNLKGKKYHLQCFQFHWILAVKSRFKSQEKKKKKWIKNERTA